MTDLAIPLSVSLGNGAPPPDANPICGVKDLDFSYDNARPVLKKINFSLYGGQKIGLTGDNGSGKTTFFRCLTGLLKPAGGIVLHEGKIMRHERDFVGLRRDVGFVLQDADDQLFFPTLKEDIIFGPLNLGLSPAEAEERARVALALVGLDGFENRQTNYLSGGEKKLAALAAILAMRPRALLLDEPLNGLDGRACRRIRDLLESLDCGMIIVSHDRFFLEDVCAGCMRLSSGTFAEAGDFPDYRAC